MATFDVTRLLEQPRKQYVGARMQQGRLLLDQDFNEGGAASDEDRRRSVQDLVGAKGTPDDGFAIGAPLALPLPAPPIQADVLRPATALPPQQFQIDGQSLLVRPVSIRAGDFYLGGLRYDMDDAEPFPLQRDFLQMRAEDLPTLETSPPNSLTTVGEFHNFYYLHTWEQAITAIEDDELLEVALGGRDTSTRTRRMRQVAIFSDFESTDAADTAWRRLLAQLQSDGSTYDADSGELLSPARLQLSFIDDPEVLDQLAVARQCRDCNPDPSTSFLAADNATIQIRLTSPTTYVWAFDNGAPLFRVRVTGLGDPSATEIRVFMMTPPLDDTQWPLANRVVEIIPFAAVLDGDVPPALAHPHFKKVADRVGAFSMVLDSFDPDTLSFTLDPSIGVDAIRDFVFQWDANHPAAANLSLTSTEGDERFFYMRLWHEAADATQVEIPISANPAGPPLAGTNIVPVFSSFGRRGDYWTATIRPETPERVLPFDLAQGGGVAPHGPHDFYAPLALLKGVNDVVNIIADRRPRITRATDSGCVTFTVGDGFQSFGDFTSIQEALDELPEEGGLIQIRQGTYREAVVISNVSALRNITIEGCGDSTILETTLDELGQSPSARAAAITITTQPGLDPTRPFRQVTVRGLRIHAIDAPGIVIQQANDPTPSVFDVEISGVAILAGTPVSPHPAVAFPDAQTLTVPLIDIGHGAQNILLRGLLMEPAGRTAIRAANASFVTIDNVVISGSPTSTSSPGPPMIDVQPGCDFVTIRDAVLSTFGQVGIATTGASRDTVIQRATVVAGQHRNIFGRITPSRTAIDVDGAQRVRVERCWITMDDTISENAGIVVTGQQIVLLGNHIEVLAHCFDSPINLRSPSACRDLRMLAWGGIQVRGNAVGVEIRENEILGGVGHGITLGSVVWTLASPPVTRREGAGRGQMSTRRDGQMGPNGNIRNVFRDPQRRLLTAQNEGALTDIVIADNRIEQMSGSGISALTVLGMGNRDDLIDVAGLRIESNTIVDNVRFPAEDVPLRTDALPFPASLAGIGVPIPFLPVGGIVLAVASNTDIRGNVIINNGTSAIIPTNGIFILCGDSIRIANNRLLGNGGRPFLDSPLAPQPSPRPGVRAGIAVMLAGTTETTPPAADVSSVSGLNAILVGRGANLNNDGTSLRVVNNCVRHPEGRALYAVATGPVSVERNFLSSEGNHGADTLNDSFAIGDIVYVQNLGTPWEADLGTDGLGTPAPDDTIGNRPGPDQTNGYLDTTLPVPPQIPPNPRFLVGAGGAILFHNNQVTFDWEVLRTPKVGVRPPISYFPVALLTIDHLGIVGNQLAFRLRGPKIRTSPPLASPPVFGFKEPVMSHVFGVGATVNASGNRIAEVVEDAILSLFTVGELLNVAALNQTTHQVLILNNAQRIAPTGVRPNDDTPLNQLGPTDDVVTTRSNQVMFDADRSITASTLPKLKDFATRFLNILLRPAT